MHVVYWSLKKFGVESIVNRVKANIENVNTIRQSRSITMATNFQSCASSSLCPCCLVCCVRILNWDIMARNSVRIAYIWFEWDNFTRSEFEWDRCIWLIDFPSSSTNESNCCPRCSCLQDRWFVWLSFEVQSSVLFNNGIAGDLWQWMSVNVFDSCWCLTFDDHCRRIEFHVRSYFGRSIHNSHAK
jgi:hypothetical protein